MDTVAHRQQDAIIFMGMVGDAARWVSRRISRRLSKIVEFKDAKFIARYPLMIKRTLLLEISASEIITAASIVIAAAAAIISTASVVVHLALVCNEESVSHVRIRSLPVCMSGRKEERGEERKKWGKGRRKRGNLP